MPSSGSSLGDSHKIFRSCKNNTNADLLKGAVVNMDRSDIVGLSVRVPQEPGLLMEFGGILFQPIENNEMGDQNDASRCVEGILKARFKGHASAVVGTWARPVAGQTYLTYSAYNTGIQLLTDMTADTDVHEVGDTIDATVYVMAGVVEPGRGMIHDIWETPVVLDVDRILDAQATSATVITTVLAAGLLAQPDTPRNITCTPGGTTTDVAAGDVVINGTNVLDEVISEGLTFAANASTVTVGKKAFKTITSVVFPIQDGAAATFDVGVGDELGLSRVVPDAPPLAMAALDDVVEGTDPTITPGATIEESTVNLDSAHDGTQVDLWVLL